MAQIINAGDNELSGDVYPGEKETAALSTFTERGLALAIALGLHVAILPWLLTKSPDTPPVSTPQALTIPLEFTLVAPAPETPSPVSEPQPELRTAPQTPVTDENAVKPAPKTLPEVKKILPQPKEKPAPHSRSAPKPASIPVKKSLAQPATVAHAADHPTPLNPAVKSASVKPVITPPLANAGYLHNPAPEYPDSAIERGLEGTVLLKVSVNAAGKATAVQIYQSSGTSALDDAALRTVRHWSFVPAKRGSEAVSGQVIVPVDFSLNS